MELNTRIILKHDTTEHWNAAITFIPKPGEIIVYDDYRSQILEDGTTQYIPGIKIGDGNAYVPDLAFVDEDTRRMILEHLTNSGIHITQADRNFWDNKISCYLSDENLVFTTANLTL